MSIRENERPIPDLVMPRHVLMSVFDKRMLVHFVESMLRVNPDVTFYSTGGTGNEVVNALVHAGFSPEKNYLSVEKLTGAPEMEGGLVKTLHPVIHAGLLAEKGNPAHDDYLRAAGGVMFDVMVGGLYPFEDVISKGVSHEMARGNIDIGGPTMIRAAAKNYGRVAVLVDPGQYSDFMGLLESQRGTTLNQRFNLARVAFNRIALYDKAISQYLNSLDFAKARQALNIEGGRDG